MSYEILDRRPGYIRQKELKDNAVIFCECGARVVLRFNELHHVGKCNTKQKGKIK